MKFDIEIEVTPEELREFLGLPDVKPMQDELLEKVRARVMANVDALDPAAVMQAFTSPGLGQIEAMQKAFWQTLASGMTKPPKPKSENKD